MKIEHRKVIINLRDIIKIEIIEIKIHTNKTEIIIPNKAIIIIIIIIAKVIKILAIKNLIIDIFIIKIKK